MARKSGEVYGNKTRSVQKNIKASLVFTLPRVSYPTRARCLTKVGYYDE
ncbi:hypothetical protein E2C01_096448 [Portunus trituberculatus]|uniref:Uncharacterized protein n=1 Tax=Portunus trituberculatus TaxID=210409 RepID=A0A5B7JSL4_PORTR|nr:hypothetical protein [Portunus trituberculatus]